MNQKRYEERVDEPRNRTTSKQILLITAIISTVFGILYFLGLMGKLIVNGSIHATSSPAISMVSAAISLLFMVLLAAISSINWYVQLTLVAHIAQSGAAATLALLDIHDAGSIMYAMEHLAWGLFYGLATIFMALAIEGGKIEVWIRWLLIAGGAMSILYIPGILTAYQVLIDLGYYAAGVLLPITTILLAIRYRV